MAIDGVSTRELKEFVNDQGSVQHMLRSTDPEYQGFGEIYFSIVNPGIIKGWNLHSKQTNSISCISGTVMMVLCDLREDSSTYKECMEITFGDDARKLIVIPPGVTFSWKSIDSAAIIANCTTHPHDPEEGTKIPIGSEKIPYEWK